MIRVLVADDQALIRGALRMLLEREEGIEFTGEAADGHDAFAFARETRPDVVLMDISMPGLDGIEATRLIAADEELAEVRVLILTSYESDEHVFEALRAGASGFLLKETEPAELVRGVRVVAAGDALLAPSVTRRLVTDFAARPSGSQPSPDQLRWLTRRECEVVALVGAGLNNEEIAEHLVISPATAKTHVSRAMRKVHAHDRAQLVVLAYESGLIAPGARQALLTDGRPSRPRLHSVGEAA